MSIDRARTGRYLRAVARWSRMLVSRRSSELSVFYGHDVVPGPGEPVAGGTAKFQKLQSRFPNDPTRFNILYLGSTWLPRDLGLLLGYARRRRIPIVLNQNGVGYPGWAGDRVEAVNAPIRRALLAADYVLYQSAFCKRSADRFVTEPVGAWEVLPNAVDTTHFTPLETPLEGPPVILLGGDQTQAYRLEVALRTVAVLRETHPDARLIVSGRLVSDPARLVQELGLSGAVEFVGRYAQGDAPALFRRAHVLLHTKVNDPCPTLVLEAMASGLPVVYPASGGVPELVAAEAGIGVPHDADFAHDVTPEPSALAEALGRVLARRKDYAAAARHRAVAHFDLERWLERHAELFIELCGQRVGR